MFKKQYMALSLVALSCCVNAQTIPELRWILQSETNDVQAERWLATSYRYGLHGVTKNADQALYWYQQSVHNNDPDAEEAMAQYELIQYHLSQRMGMDECLSLMHIGAAIQYITLVYEQRPQRHDLWCLVWEESPWKANVSSRCSDD